MKFKVGDRVYFETVYAGVKYTGTGIVAQVDGDGSTSLNVESYSTKRADGSPVFHVEPHRGEVLLPDYTFNSPLYEELK